MAYVDRTEAMEMIEGTASKFQEDVQILTYTTKFEKQPVSERFFLEHSETSVNAFSEDFFVHTDTYTTLEEKLSQNENKEGFEKSMEYQTWRVQGFYPWNKIEELKKLASSPNLFFGYLKFDFVHFSKRGIEITHNIPYKK